MGTKNDGVLIFDLYCSYLQSLNIKEAKNLQLGDEFWLDCECLETIDPPVIIETETVVDTTLNNIEPENLENIEQVHTSKSE